MEFCKIELDYSDRKKRGGKPLGTGGAAGVLVEPVGQAGGAEYMGGGRGTATGLIQAVKQGVNYLHRWPNQGWRGEKWINEVGG